MCFGTDGGEPLGGTFGRGRLGGRMRLLAPLLCALALAACGSKSASTTTTGGEAKPPPVLGRPGTSKQAVQELGFPGFATKNTTRVGGADPIADAAAVARAVYPGGGAGATASRPRVVVLADERLWQAGPAPARLVSGPLRGPPPPSGRGGAPAGGAG